jgi:hypothetical protein
MQFNLDAFGFLNGEEFTPGWSNLGQFELDAITSTLLSGDLAEEAGAVINTVDTFFSTLDKLKPAIVGEFDEANLLSIHADEMGLMDVVLSFGVFQDENGLPVIKSGSNLFSLNIDGSSATAGNLEGDIEVLEVGEDDRKIVVVALDCLIDGSEETLSIPFVLTGSDETRPNKALIKKAIKSGALASLLKPVPTGGGFTKMNDLKERTEYRVLSIEERPVHEEYGRSWLIELEGVGNIISKGKRFEKGLAQNAGIYQKMLAAGQPLTLLVSSIKEIASGTQVQAGFFKRAPKPEFVYKPVLKSAAPVNDFALAPAIEVETVVIPDEQTSLMATASY